MDVTIIEGLITTIGFPIVCCGALYIQNKKTTERLMNDSKEREDKLFEELSANRIINAGFARVLEQYGTNMNSLQSDVKAIKEKVGA